MSTEIWEDEQLQEALEYLERATDMRIIILDNLELLECEIIACQSTIELIIETLNDRVQS